jgi:hypothetical protein
VEEIFKISSIRHAAEGDTLAILMLGYLHKDGTSVIPRTELKPGDYIKITKVEVKDGKVV